jgi:type I restriction enzyme S subunit
MLATSNLLLFDLRPNPHWASLPLFDRSGWTRVRFGDVVENVNETERSPAEAGIDRFIAMEHLEPGSLHVREWGNVADGTTFTRRCRPGQVLFGKRRAYQRKVAVAEFDAVVSGDIYVLAPKDDWLISGLLPFLCLSERFFQHAVGTSAGSLSPRTNWSSLANFEFDLPPLDQQRRVAEIFWELDRSREAKIALHASATQARVAYSAKLFSTEDVSGRVSLGSVCRFQSGFPFKSADFCKEGDRLLRGSNVGVNTLLWDSEITRFFPTSRRSEVVDFVLQAGDTVVAMDRPFISEGFKIARIGEHDLPCLLLQRVGRFHPTDELDRDFLWMFLSSESFQRQIMLSQQGSDLPHISKFDVESTTLVLPPLNDQIRLAAEYSRYEQASNSAKLSALNTETLTAEMSKIFFG